MSGSAFTSKSLFWMTTGLFLGLGVLLAIGIYTAYRVYPVLQNSPSGDDLIVSMPSGDYRVEKPEQIGPSLPVYPLASLVLPGKNAYSAHPSGKSSAPAATNYFTSDSRATVDTWYREHLSPEFMRYDAGDNPLPAILHDAQVTPVDIAFLGERGDQVRIVVLALEPNGTRISFLRSTDKTPKESATPTSGEPN